MSVVARVSCHSVEHTTFGTTVKMQPVVPQDDPHSEEIKRFFAATPSGNVKLAAANKEVPLGAEPGDQFYLYLAYSPVTANDIAVKVTSVSLSGYATTVRLSAKSSNVPPWQPCEMEFSIRNEIAAEQFQVGVELYAHLEKIAQ